MAYFSYLSANGVNSGASARMVSKYRPVCPIIMVTRNAAASRVRAYVPLECYSFKLILATVFSPLSRRLSILLR